MPAPPRIPYTTCPLCGGNPSFDREANITAHPSYHRDLPALIQWAKCDSCAHSFTSGYWSEESMALILQHTQPDQTVGYNVDAHRAVSARMVERVTFWGGHEDGPWLDVGFGNGSLMMTAREYGFEPEGTELRPANLAAMKTLDYNVTSRLPQVSAVYNVISLCDVLEHLPDPVAMLQEASEALKDGGTLLISCPAYQSPIWNLLDHANANPYWAELEHYHNFSRSRLTDLCSTLGLTLRHYTISDRYRACMELIFTKDA